MDAFYLNQSTQNSQQHRSRSNSHLSSTAEQLSSLNIETSDQERERSKLPIFQRSNHLDLVSPSRQQDFIPAPIPQQSLPFPLLSEEDLNPTWSYLAASEDHPPAPLLRLDPPESISPGEQQHHSHSDRRSIRSSFNPGTMSALGIQQYNAPFDASIYVGIRHTFTWPGSLDIQDQHFIQHNPCPGQLASSLYDEPKLIPTYPRSTSSSPPRANLTPEQRELKRQRDYARRDSKTRVRRDRSSSNQSNPYIMSQTASPDLLPRTLPEYTNSLVPSPLQSQGSIQNSPALGSNPFLSPISPYTPRINEHPSPKIFGPVYTMGSEFSTPAYIPYPSISDSSLIPFINRPHSLSLSSTPDHTSLYRTQQLSPKLLTSNNDEQVRLVHSRPKPQCWEHGCNGRQFSTFSNLLRHQREKSGAAQKSSCPNCGAEFTRTTARNGHMTHDKCKARSES